MSLKEMACAAESSEEPSSEDESLVDSDEDEGDEDEDEDEEAEEEGLTWDELEKEAIKCVPQLIPGKEAWLAAVVHCLCWL